MNEDRLNIVTVGVLAGALAQLFCFAWNHLLPNLVLGGNEGAAVATVFMYLAQRLDRGRKRNVGHVVAKYRDQRPGQAPEVPADVQ